MLKYFSINDFSTAADVHNRIFPGAKYNNLAVFQLPLIMRLEFHYTVCVNYFSKLPTASSLTLQVQMLNAKADDAVVSSYNPHFCGEKFHK